MSRRSLGGSLLALALAPAPALAAPEDALDPVSRQFYDDAATAEAAGQYPRAETLYRLLHTRNADFTPATLALGRVLEAEGRSTDAEALYRSLGLDPDAVEALARLVADRDPDAALALDQQLESLRLGDAAPFCAEVLLYARTSADHPERVDLAAAAWERCATLSGDDEPPAAPLLALLDVTADADAATALIADRLARWPDTPEAAELRTRLDRIGVERSARAVVLGGSQTLGTGDEARLSEARAALARDPDAARVLAESVLEHAPRAAEAHAVLSDAAFGKDWAAAEIHALLARQLDPDVAANHLRVARILHVAYGGRRDAEALVALRQAAALRPDEAAILLQLADLEASQGQWERERAALKRWLQVATEPAGAEADDVRERIAALDRSPPVVPSTGASPALPGISDDAAAAWRIAIVYLDRGDLGPARTELDRAMTLAPHVPALLNLDARLRRESGDVHGAIVAWQQSLLIDARQGDVQLALGETLDAQGDGEGALTHYRAAADTGEADAHYFLARSAAALGDWQTVQSELSAFAGAGGRASLYAVAAERLGAEADRHVWTVRAVGAALLLGILGFPTAFVVWRRGGVDLRHFLDRSPGAWHDAARILAAIRHEVLKHNTTVLPDLARALDNGDRASWDGWRPGAGDLLTRFDGYVGALESLADQHGLRLATHRDPILAPMRASLKALVRAAKRNRSPRPADLRVHSEALNGRGYAALGTLVTEICILPVTVALIESVYARVSGEPGFRGDRVPLSVSGVPGQVRMFRGDLEDILANLFRNALAAGAHRVDVVLGEDSDPITGHSWFELRVEDDAPGQLTTGMIRGRYISRGLGLAVDLLNRHGGTIRVDPAPADGDRARKAVVVQIPAVEAANVEVEWR